MHIKTVGSYEAKTHLPALLDAVANGEQIIITRRGIPVAILGPYSETGDSIDAAINALLKFRKGRSLKGLSMADMKNNGRK
jgi:prevent-host-death family protein